ncbi:MAG: hypothetical protein NT047_07535 [Deltaproteobacteria bacterium]|nr:hypothetical protein [Deltaproteobacteria bacterium]
MSIREITKEKMGRMPVMIAVAILLVMAVGALMICTGLVVEHSPAVAGIGTGFVAFGVWCFYSY